MSNQLEKNALRALYKQKRNAFAVENAELCLQTDEMICKNLVANDAYKSANSIFTYVSIGDETDTLRLIDQAYADGKTVCFPRTAGRGENAHMDAIKLTKNEYLKMMEAPDGAFGIPEPPAYLPAAAPEDLDLIIVPSLAIDKNGIRLGYGGGYYDRYIENVRSKNPVASPNSETKHTAIIAIQRSVFVVETNLPCEKHDQKVDAILTEHGFISSLT